MLSLTVLIGKLGNFIEIRPGSRFDGKDIIIPVPKRFSLSGEQPLGSDRPYDVARFDLIKVGEIVRDIARLDLKRVSGSTRYYRQVSGPLISPRGDW